MSTIWKYELEVTDKQSIEMPTGAKVLTIQTQNGKPMLWAQVNEHELQSEGHVFLTFGTGNPIPEHSNLPKTYIGTYQIEGGLLVFHVFEQSWVKV